MPTLQKDKLTHKQILEWADLHHDETGEWPISRAGPIFGTRDETWEGMNSALARGGRGLPGGDSLHKLLKRKRGVDDPRKAAPEITVNQILQWADEHQQRTGEWPYRESGRVAGRPHISWGTIDRYLKRGTKRLPGGDSLSKLLRKNRSVWDGGKVMLTPELVLEWARQHHGRTGKWPVTLSGRVHGRPFEDWAAIDMALRHKRRGIRKKTSLSKLLSDKYGTKYNPHSTKLSKSQIIDWANEHHKRTGHWPTAKSGQLNNGEQIAWGTIDSKLRYGGRGLRGGSSLAAVLERHCR